MHFNNYVFFLQGLSLECDNGFVSSQNGWEAVGSDQENEYPPTSGYSSNVCISSSGYYLPGQNSAAQKIWPNNGKKYAWFKTVPVNSGFFFFFFFFF